MPVTMTCSTSVSARHSSQHVRDVLEDHDRLRAGVLQLVLELAVRVERVGVDDREPGAQRAEQRDRVLQDVRHHQRDAVAPLQPRLLLQPRPEGAAQRVELAES